ncbi:MAG: LysM peptidoglycan-binding domain-containing protein [Microbacterium ginsengisoli]|jgi:hypothetical protein|uniref:LysM peptidoglycan-binding domain-containing protein n=1 Tax=Microbacterium TaxID=33882 RepID=UPI0006F40355|nr:MULTISPECIES: LysM peptidoglycan-binding domain-containing protein [unclassified Microbacterium]KQR92272.1 hypothetical protein ASG00_03530 [Microbacterium sp. Leaf351]KQR92794.1 hypothetical protein ASF93_04715 [Microbacterium sp. Leaf347]MBN9198973.1 LysM peptidoglycan-binding domain-containing protein [Microbacterium ginsengisoli]OJU76192.1 MAG: hypothetical protein BGO15_05355 [Microbacterium sp. 71-23]
MTTIPLTLAPRTRLRMTRRGRRVLVFLAALPFLIGVSAGIVSGGAALASRDAGAPAGTYQTVTVEAGDSLWSIAERVAPQADPRDVVDAFVRLNALGNGTVVAGEQLSIPTEYAPAR